MTKDFLLKIPQLLFTLAGIGLFRFIVDKHLLINYLDQLKLKFYQVPTEQELKLLRQDPKKYEQHKKSPTKTKSKHKSSPRLTPPRPNEVFKILNKNLFHLKLDKHDLNKYDIARQPLSQEAESIMALWVAVTMVYFMTELYIGITGYQGFNYSTLWLVFALFRGFYHMTYAMYYNVFYWNFSISATFVVCLVTSMQLVNGEVVLHCADWLVEFDLDDSYEFVMGMGIGATPFTVLFAECAKLALATVTCLISTLYILPAWRIGTVHKTLLNERLSKWEYFQILHAHSHAFIALALFIKPLGRAAATAMGMSSCTFESIRIMYIMISLIAKAYTLPHYLRMYLEHARKRVELIAKDEEGKGHTTNWELNGSISEYAITVNLFIIQFMTPVLIHFCLVALYKTTGCFQWLPFLTSPAASTKAPVPEHYLITLFKLIPGGYTTRLVNLFDVKLFRGLLAYGLWFSIFSWVSCSAIGIINAVVNGP